MKHYLLSLICLLFSVVSNAQWPHFSKLCVDRNSNIGLVGKYQYSMVFRNATVSDAYMMPQPFLARLDSDYNLLWCKTFSSESSEDFRDMNVVNDREGNLYIASCHYGSLNLGTAYIPSSSVFIAKFDTAGNLLWYRNSVGTISPWNVRLGIDSTDRLFLSSNYSSLLSFDTDTVTSTPGGAFVACFDTGGNRLWLTNLPGEKTIEDMKTDPDGNCYISGTCIGLQICGTHTQHCSSDLPFILKCAGDGVPQWQKIGTGLGATATAIALGNFNYPITIGLFRDSVLFDTTQIIGVGSGRNMFLVNHTDTGTLKANTTAHPQFDPYDRNYYATSDSNGNAYFSAHTVDTVAVIGATDVGLTGTQQHFIAKIDTDLNMSCVIRMDINGNSPHLATGPDGSLYGTFQAWTLSVEDSVIDDTRVFEQKHIFILRFDANCNLLHIEDVKTVNAFTEDVPHTNLSNIVSVYPNPTSSLLNVSIKPGFSGTASLRVRDITGRVISSNLNISSQLSLNLSDYPNGIYILEVATPQSVYVTKFQVIH